MSGGGLRGWTGGRERSGGSTLAVAAGAAIGVTAGVAACLACARRLGLACTHAGLARVKVVRGSDGERVRVLQQGGVYQSATFLGERRFEPVFEYIRSFDTMFEAERAMRGRYGHGIDRVLMLGGGGYSYPKHALTANPRLRMDVVEFDPAVTLLARRWFFLDDLERGAGGRLGLVRSDARGYMERAAAGGVIYDVVVNDCFTGSEPVRSLATVEALRLSKTCLEPGGIYMANVVSTGGGENIDFLRDVAATALAVFAGVWILPCVDEVFAGEDNYLLIASDAPYVFRGSLPFDDDFLGEVMRD